MLAPKLRVFHPDLNETPPSATARNDLRYSNNKVSVAAGETLALLMHAARTDRAWLSDFADETIEVSQDMYEVLLAYKRIAREENARAA